MEFFKVAGRVLKVIFSILGWVLNALNALLYNGLVIGAGVLGVVLMTNGIGLGGLLIVAAIILEIAYWAFGIQLFLD